MSLPAILLSSCFRFVDPRELVQSCCRVNRSWRDAAALPFSTKVLPSDSDASVFLCSRSASIWPWRFDPFAKDQSALWSKVRRAASSKLAHQVRIWPAIPIKTSADVGHVASLKHLHTLHLSDECLFTSALALLHLRPFPFMRLHSLSLPWFSRRVADALPPLLDLRRLALTGTVCVDAYPFDPPGDASNRFVHAADMDQHRLKVEQFRGSPMSAAEMRTAADKFPNLAYIDLPSTFQLTADHPILALIRALQDLQQVEAKGILSKPVLEALAVNPAPPSLAALVDCGFEPANPGRHGNFKQTALSSDLLPLLARLPAYARIVQPRTLLSDLTPLLTMARLTDLHVCAQSLSAELDQQCMRVFPALNQLRSLRFCGLLASDAPDADRARWCSVLRSLRTLAGLTELTFEEVPLFNDHLQALLGSDAELSALQKAKDAADAAARSNAQTQACSLDDAEAETDAADAAASFFIFPRLQLLTLRAINMQPPPNDGRMLSTLVNENTQGQADWTRLAHERVLPLDCRVSTKLIIGLGAKMILQKRFGTRVQ